MPSFRRGLRNGRYFLKSVGFAEIYIRLLRLGENRFKPFGEYMSRGSNYDPFDQYMSTEVRRGWMCDCTEVQNPGSTKLIEFDSRSRTPRWYCDLLVKLGIFESWQDQVGQESNWWPFVERLLAFLELYGENGVSVHELLHLAHKSLEFRFPTAATYGQAYHGSPVSPTLPSPLEALSYLSWEDDALRALETKLWHPQYIEVSRAVQYRETNDKFTSAIGEHTRSFISRFRELDGKAWRTTSWRAATKRFSGDETQWKDLFNAFGQFVQPESPFLTLDVREMERYYYHTHAAILFILPRLGSSQKKDPNNTLKPPNSQGGKRKLLLLAYRTLLLRFQPHDASLLRVLKALINEWEPSPSSTELLDIRRDISMIVAGVEEDFDIENILSRIVRRPLNEEDAKLRCLLLVEWYDIAVSGGEDVGKHYLSYLQDYERKIRHHYESTFQFANSNEAKSLIPVLIRLRAWSQLALLPRKTSALYGYHLSREGFLDLAARYLDEDSAMDAQHTIPSLWQYQIELATVKLRQGDWKTAMQILDRLYAKVQRYCYEVLSRKRLTFGSYINDIVEISIAIACLRSDHQASHGSFDEARDFLDGLVDPLEAIRENGVASTRRAVKARVLIFQEISQSIDVINPAASLLRELNEEPFVAIDAVEIDCIYQSLLVYADRLADSGLRQDADFIYFLMLTSKAHIVQSLPEPVKTLLRNKASKDPRYGASWDGMQHLGPVSSAAKGKRPELPREPESETLESDLTVMGNPVIDSGRQLQKIRRAESMPSKITQLSEDASREERPGPRFEQPVSIANEAAEKTAFKNSMRSRPIAPLSYLREKMFPSAPKHEPRPKETEKVLSG